MIMKIIWFEKKWLTIRNLVLSIDHLLEAAVQLERWHAFRAHNELYCQMIR